MSFVEVLKKENTIIDKPELNNLKVLYWIDVFLLITDFLMPQYFGVDVGFDLTCTRFANVLIILYLFFNQRILQAFFKNCLKIGVTVPLVLYLLVALYTMIFRVDINAFMMVFFEIITMYMLFFGIRYVIGIKKSFKIIVFCAYFLSIYGLLEFIAGESLYLKFLRTVPTAVTNCYRSGSYRIMGPCGHPLGYGLLLLLFIAVSCINFNRDDIYLFQRPFLLALLFVNVMLTGSRSTLAISVIEMILIVFFSRNNSRKKALFISIIIIVFFSILVFATKDTKFGNYILRQITGVMDLAFDTQLSEKYGAEVERLEDSSEYREFLPKIFTLEWLSPIVGRGVKRSFGAEFTGADGTTIFIRSVDNYYVAQYIKYAYPGMFSYCLFIIAFIVTMFRKILLHKSKILTTILIGFCCYFFNLWYLDALQTLKFVYVLVAFSFSLISAVESIKKEEYENA